MTMKRATRTKLKAKITKKSAAPKATSEAAMMAQWMKAATPAAEHKRLDPIVGSFRTKTTFVMAPGAPPQTSEAISEHRWVLGGRFVEQRYKGMSMGMPFEGIGYTGYDNVTKRYVGTWMDTFCTGMMTSVGTGRPTDKEIRAEAEAWEPSGKKTKFETIVRIKDRNRHSYEMWTKAPNGKRYRVMIAEYTRA